MILANNTLASLLTHTITLDISIEDTTAHPVQFFVTTLSDFDLFLGKPWFLSSRAIINFENLQLSFRVPIPIEDGSDSTTEDERFSTLREDLIEASPQELDAPDPGPSTALETQIYSPTPTLVNPSDESSSDLSTLSSQSDSSVRRPQRWWDMEERHATVPQPHPQLHEPPTTVTDTSSIPTASRSQPFSTQNEMQEWEEQIRQVVDEDEDEVTKRYLPKEYHDYLDVFRKSSADKLPPHRPYDHKIPLQPGTSPPFGPIYSLSEAEHRFLREYLKENQDKGFIRPSSSPAGAPVLFVKKPDGSFRLCVDYRGLNNITEKDRYSIPKSDDLFDRIRGSKIFSKVDLRGAYNLLRMMAGEEWKTAFRTRYGSFEYLVMPFGLAGAPSSFQRFMNDIFRDLVDVIVIIYLDDFLIFSKSLSEHREHVKIVLERLRSAGLYAKAEKCVFEQEAVEFLGYQLSSKGISMVDDKIQSILSWPSPTTVKELQSFLGFANFYRRFIWNYSEKVSPLTGLLKKNLKWDWTERCQSAFENLKTSFTTAPILQHYDPEKPITLETDASDYAIAAVASQPGDDGLLHPIGFRSRKMSSAELNYDIHDKEMLAIVDTFIQWRHLLQDAAHTVTIYTDHKNLEYFTTSKVLNRRQARWAMLLSSYDFKITYRPGTQGGKPDAMTRRSDYHPGTTHGKYVEHNPQNQQVLLPPSKHNLFDSEHARAITTFEISSPSFHDQLRLAYDSDPEAIEIIARLQEQDIEPQKKYQNDKTTQKRSLASQHLYSVSSQHLIYYDSRLFVPASLRLDILKSRHDHQLAGHPGRRKTLQLIQRDFFWPGMRQQIHEYVDTCDLCARTKVPRHKPYGFLKSLPTPQQPWTDISMDLIEALPLSDGFDSILVIVCRLTKMSLFIPTHTTMTSQDLARLYIKHVFSKHGCPRTILSDRGSEFVSSFWRSICKLLGIQQALSTAFRPQTDGQTERTNQTLEQYLRLYADYQQSNWSEMLPMAEFAYNNSEHAAIKTTPFFANKGYHPRFDIIEELPDTALHPVATDLSSRLSSIHKELATNIARANENSARAYNSSHMDPPDFQVDDMVMLSTRNIRTTRPTKKLDYRFIGPYKIIAKISSHAYRLELPASMRIHNVFHVSLLEPHKANTLSDREQPPPPPIEVDGQLEYEVERIVDSKHDRRYTCTLRYLVEWSGYTGDDRFTWEPADDLSCNDHIRDFHKRHPEKPGPLSSFKIT